MLLLEVNNTIAEMKSWKYWKINVRPHRMYKAKGYIVTDKESSYRAWYLTKKIEKRIWETTWESVCKQNNNVEVNTRV